MARTVPLIRGTVLFPMFRWLQTNGDDVQACLRAAGLDRLDDATRERPIPLLTAFDMHRRLAAQEGPDACARIVTADSLEDLGIFGRLIRGARTPREALVRAAQYLPCYSTHETVVLRRIAGGLRVDVGWSFVLDDEMMHLSQQFSASLVAGLCLSTRLPPAMPMRIRIRPHPVSGVDHLRQILGEGVQASDEAVLSVDLEDAVLDAPMHLGAGATLDLPPQHWSLPRGAGSFRQSVCLAVDSLGTSHSVRIEHVAALAGMSVRTFQRMLASDGISFRSLVDDLRRAKSVEILSSDTRSANVVADDLGFSGQSSMARAVRRWTGASPKRLRRTLEPEQPSVDTSTL